MTSDDRVQRLRRPDGNTVAYATTSGRTPTVAFLGGFRSDMTGTKAMALEDWARADRPRLRALRLSRSRPVVGSLRGRHDRPLARRFTRGARPAHRGQAGAGRIEHGRLAVAAGGAGAARAPGWPGADRRGARLHRAHAAEGPVARGSRAAAARGTAGASVAILARTVGLHLEADRGGAQSSPARQEARAALPGAAAARPERSRRAVGVFAADREPSGGARGDHDLDQGRRPSPQHTGRHRRG